MTKSDYMIRKKDLKNLMGYDGKVFLVITSWMGYSPGAIHYYGKLDFNNFGIDLNRKVTKTDKRIHPRNYRHKEVGSIDDGFNTKSHIITLGKAFLKKWKIKMPLKVVDRTLF